MRVPFKDSDHPGRKRIVCYVIINRANGFPAFVRALYNTGEIRIWHDDEPGYVSARKRALAYLNKERPIIYEPEDVR